MKDGYGDGGAGKNLGCFKALQVRRCVEQSLLKAREFALLAVKVYNDPATKMRSPHFVVLMHIVGTCLFPTDNSCVYEQAYGDCLYTEAWIRKLVKYWRDLHRPNVKMGSGKLQR